MFISNIVSAIDDDVEDELLLTRCRAMVTSNIPLDLLEDAPEREL